MARVRRQFLDARGSRTEMRCAARRVARQSVRCGAKDVVSKLRCGKSLRCNGILESEKGGGRGLIIHGWRYRMGEWRFCVTRGCVMRNGDYGGGRVLAKVLVVWDG